MFAVVGVVLEKENGPTPPSKFNKTQYLLTEAKFEFAVKTKKFLGGVSPMGTKPPGPEGPQPNCPTGQAVRGTGWG